jgi:hypothetical protein
MPGIALRGETCGALTGPLLALGMAFGRDRLDDQAGFRNALPPARDFCRRFETEFGSTRCDEILASRLGRPFDLARQADFAAYQECGGLESCTTVIRTATRMAAAIILAQRPESNEIGSDAGGEIGSDAGGEIGSDAGGEIGSDPGVMLTA